MVNFTNTPHSSSDKSITRCGFVAIIGPPNAGKSTFLNYVIGQKISIVTHKIQTTRMPIKGIYTQNNDQVIFLDTPGIFQYTNALEQTMVNSAWKTRYECDILLFLLDATNCKKILENQHILNKIHASPCKKIMVFNKIDLIPSTTLLPILSILNESGIFNDIFLVSAKTGDGIDTLVRFLLQHIPETPWFYPEYEHKTDCNLTILLSEITREKVMLRVHQEIPYAVCVTTTSCTKKTNMLHIMQTIYVKSLQHKKIIIGKQGSTLKHIGTSARTDMEVLCRCKVFLDLHIVISEKKIRNTQYYCYT